jgi:hypothetical protein
MKDLFKEKPWLKLQATPNGLQIQVHGDTTELLMMIGMVMENRPEIKALILTAVEGYKEMEPQYRELNKTLSDPYNLN